MTDRTIAIRLTANVAEHNKNIDLARERVQAYGAETVATANRQEAMQQAVQKVGQGFLVGGLAIGAGVALVVTAYARYDKALSGFDAVAQVSDATLSQLGDTAVTLGKKYGVGASDAIAGATDLKKAGVEVADIMGGALNGALTLTAAGNMSVGDSAETAAIAMTQFGLSGKDVPHIADLLAAGAGKAVGEVSDLAAALRQSGLVASQFGLSLDETVGGLSAFASAGLIGSDAGTSFKSMLLSMASPTGVAAKEMAKYNLDLYDGEGHFIGLSAAAGALQTSFKGVSDENRQAALSIIFGQDAIRSATVLYQQGAAGIEKWTDMVNDAGYAEEMATAKLNNLDGDWKKFNATLEGDFIKAGSGANDILRGLVQGATGLLDVVGAVPAPVLATTLVLGALGAGLLIATGAFILGVPKVLAFRAALATISETAPGVAANVGRVTSALGAIGRGALALSLLVGLFQMFEASLKPSTAELAKMDAALERASSGTAILKSGIANVESGSDSFNRAAAKLENLDGVLDITAARSKDFWGALNNGGAPSGVEGYAFSDAEKALKAIGGQLGTLAETNLPAAQKAFSLLVEKTDGSEQSQWRLLRATEGYEAGLRTQAEALGINVDTTDDAVNKQRLLELAQGTGLYATKTLTDGTTALADSTQAQAQASEEASEALAKWIEATSDADAAFVDLGSIMDNVREKNKAAAEGLADAWNEANPDEPAQEWGDFYDGMSVSIEDYMADLQRQVDAQTNWEANMIALSGRVSTGMIDELRDLGPEGADQVALLNTMTDEQLAVVEANFGQRAAGATGQFASTLNNAAPVIAAAGAQLGQGAAMEIATKLANGTSTVDQIMTDYGITIESIKPEVTVTAKTDAAVASINSVQTALDSLDTFKSISVAISAVVDAATSKADGGLIPNMAGGSPSWFGNGVVTGPGGSRDDKVKANLSPGEFVVNARQTAAHLSDLIAINAGQEPSWGDNGVYGTPTYLRSSQGSTTGGSTTTVNNSFTIHAAPGMDEDALTDRIARKFDKALR
ncbi:phage tail tape measure protein [Agreia sp. PsM10]|uniref:phage tail tape measure protein n=1 Tax=Agreia sp. PsM10 TaxID=3030533 RepID=UPI00263BC690|nr:phage tail tape measure protein [Agreia sp. PsM10]MDN4639702.1 phage tail tape measure protein [Agreia sp. PsM10]